MRRIVGVVALVLALPVGALAGAAAGGGEATPFKLEPRSVVASSSVDALLQGEPRRLDRGGLMAVLDAADQPAGRLPGGLMMIMIEPQQTQMKAKAKHQPSVQAILAEEAVLEPESAAVNEDAGVGRARSGSQRDEN